MNQACVIPRWKLLADALRNLDPFEFIDAARSARNAVLIDVRTREEFDQGSIKGALHLNYLSYTFLDELDKLDRDRTYFLYCRTGRRSVRTGILMKNWGFCDLVNMEGGLAAVSQDQISDYLQM